ncbi:hypothetical protein H4R23_000970 [Coemansia sp. Cherry 401B]|nr:hypothetical protein H4R23_000970 [Coemansia sp. Cherry 401B]
MSASKDNDSDDSDTMFPSFSSAPKADAHRALVKHEKRSQRHDADRKQRKRRKEKRQHRIEPAREDDTTILQKLVADRTLSIDTRGEAQLRQFQQTGKSAAPRFVRRGGRMVLGLGRRFRIDSERKRDTDISKYDSDDDSGRRFDFKSLEGMAREPVQNPTESAAEDPAQAEIRRRTTELEARIKADKHDIDAWKQLIAHQETVVESSFGSSSRLKLRHAVSAVQAEMYRRAMQSNPDSRDLVLGYLDACMDTMDDETVLDEWRAAVERTADPQVVLRYLQFCQTLAACFSVPWMADNYATAVRHILRCYTRCPDKEPEIGPAIAELIHSACLFFRESGFAERALAVYQAALEWYVMTPGEKQQTSMSHRLREFRQMWNSGWPRIGAESAKGWTAYLAADPAAPTDPATSPQGESSASTIDAWCDLEMRRSKLAMVPHLLDLTKRDSEHIESVDPFSIVVFDDVEPYLADLRPNAATAQMLVDGFLQFLGVVGPQTRVLSGRSGHASELVWTVPGIGDDMFTVIDEHSLWPIPAAPGNPEADPERAFPFVSVPVTLDTPDTPLPYVHACPWMQPANAAYRGIAHNALMQLQRAEQLDERSRMQLSVAQLEWAFVQSTDNGSAMGRCLLAQRPECLALWNTLAKMHARTGNWPEARRVWAAALAAAPTLPAAEQPWVAVLCKSWTVLEAMHGGGVPAGIGVLAAVEDPDALKRLAGMPAADGECDLGADLECARRIIDKLGQFQGVDTPNEARLAVGVLRQWAAYAARRDPQAALAEYRQQGCGADTEAGELAICSLLLFHIRSSRVHRIGDLRQRLQTALLAYPHSTALW